MSADPTATAAQQHRTKLHFQLFSDAYSASCSCGWRVSSCTDRERIVRFKTEHEREHASTAAPPLTRWQRFGRVVAAAFSGPSGGGPQ